MAQGRALDGSPPGGTTGSPGDAASVRDSVSSPRPRALLHLPAPVVVRLLALGHIRRIREAHRDFAATGGAERLHDLRVTVRRLRSLFRAYASEVKGSVRRKDRRRLRDVATATAALRELDVRFAWVDDVPLDSEEFAVVERLRAEAAETRDDEVAAVREWLDRAVPRLVRRLRKRLRRYTLDLDGRNAAGGPVFAVVLADTLTRLRHQFEEQLERVADTDDESQIHAARIGAKRLRYAIEPVTSTAAGAAATAHLVSLQDRLGRFLDMGDAAVVFDGELAAAHRADNDRAVSGLQGLLAHARAERAELLAAVRADWVGDSGRSRLAAVDDLVQEVLAAADLPPVQE